MRGGFVVWSLAVLLAVAVCLPVAAAPGAAGRVTCTGVVIRLPGTIAFQGSHGPVLRAVETNLPAGRYTVRYDAASRVLRIAPWRPGWRLKVDLAGSPQEKILFQVYLATMAKPIPLRIAAAGGQVAGQGSACVACTHVDALAAGDGQDLVDALSQRLPLRERGYWMRWTTDLASQAAWAARQRRLHDQVQGLLATGGARSLPRWQTTRAAYGDPARREAEHTLAAWEKELWRAYLAQYGETMDVRDPAQRDLRITQAVRLSMALRMSPQYMAPGARDAARALFDDPMFISSTIMGITAYFALVAVPEPILTKASAVLTTIALVSLAGFAASELVTLARAWMRLRDESAAARSLGELERAAMHFGHSIGGAGLRILAVLATVVVGQTLPGAPPAGAAAGPVVLAVTTRGGTLATLTAAEMVEIGWVVQVLKNGAVILMATSAAGGGPGPDMSPGLAGAGGSGATAAGSGGGSASRGGGKGPGPGGGGLAARGKAARPPAATAPTLGPPAAPGRAKRFLAFTYKNLRKNLIRLTGGAPEGTQAHHVLPREFREDFQKAGINIHDPHYGAWWEAGAHRRAAAQYNAQWRKFLHPDETASAEIPSAEEILEFGRAIARQYGLHIYF